jgi:hypothetical protein
MIWIFALVNGGLLSSFSVVSRMLVPYTHRRERESHLERELREDCHCGDILTLTCSYFFIKNLLKLVFS